MTRKRERAFALVAAVVLFSISVAASAVVIWQIRQDNKQNSATSNPAANNQNKLEGTKLADFKPVTTVDKLQIIDIKTGTGEAVQPGATITAHYTGALAKDGTIFQSSHDGANQPFTASLSGVIPGWQQGIPGMKVGGKRRLIIPAALAYGAQSPAPNIPPNSDLVFDIELISVQK